MIDIPKLKRWVVFDTETTGLDPINDRIVEHGCILVENNEIKDTYNVIVKQNIHIPEFVAGIHGITDEIMARKGVDPKEACEKVLKFMGDEVVVGTNSIAFDLPFLEAECNRYKLSRPKVSNWYDVGLDFKAVHIGHIWDRKEEFFKFAYRIGAIRARGVKFNLNHMAKELEVDNLRDEIGGLHGALVDIKLLNHVFMKFKNKYYAA